MKKLILIFFIAVSVFGQSYTYQGGVEKITVTANRDFSSDTGFWTKSGASVTIANGVCRFYSAGAGANLYRNNLLTIGKTYLITYTISNYSLGSFRVELGNVTPYRTAAGTYQDVVVAKTVDIYFIHRVGTGTYDLDNVSIQEVLSASPIGEPKRNFIYNTQESDASLVFSYNGEKPVNGILVDKSTYQNNGTLYGGTVYNGGVEGGLQFNGRSSYVSVADANSLDFGTGNFSMEVRIKFSQFKVDYFFSKRASAIGYGMYPQSVSATSSKIYFAISDNVNVTQVLSNTTFQSGIDYFIQVSVSRVGLASIYVNGVLDNTVDVSARSNSISNSGDLRIGAFGTTYHNCTIYSAKLYNRALTATEVREKYNKLAKQVYLYEDMSDYAVGSFPREWVKKSGTFTVQEYNITAGELITNGSFTGASTGWNLSGGATYLSNAIAFTSSGGIYQTISGLTAGQTYQITFTISGWSSGKIDVQTFDGTVVYTSSQANGTYTAQFSMPFSSNQTRLYLQTNGAAVLTLDNVSLQEIPPIVGTIKKGTKYLRCDVAGIVAIPSNWANGTIEMDLYKGNATNNAFLYPISDRIANSNSLLGYRFFFQDDERIYFDRVNNGSSSLGFYTNTSYISNTTWHRIKITRTTAGVFTVYIKGGSFGNNYVLVSTSGGSGTNPVTDNTYTTSNWFVLDLDAGDRFSGLVMTKGIPQ